MKPPPHICGLCSYRATCTGHDATAWYYLCPNCQTIGTEKRP